MKVTSRYDWQGPNPAGRDRQGTSKFSFRRVLDNNSGHDKHLNYALILMLTD